MTAQTLELDRIYRQYGAMVRRRCLCILKREDDAEDAAQEVFVRVLRSMGAFRGQSSPATWLYRIATNICLNRIRDARNRERLDLTALEEPAPTQPVEAWQRDLVIRLLADFDDATREAVLYAEVEEMTHQEIAEILGCSVSLVRKRIAKFKEKARQRAARLLRAVP
ncbi:MAG: sigma-70 family RNA polymerase sigma factor [Proteobacteria bacterium]|nr:sigma-70 family RNA polymerase sigma factor [Pseudomonadota bacterium]